MGNKDDNPDTKVVLREDAEKFANQMGIQLFETSAKENINVEEVRTYLYKSVFFRAIKPHSSICICIF